MWYGSITYTCVPQSYTCNDVKNAILAIACHVSYTLLRKYADVNTRKRDEQWNILM